MTATEIASRLQRALLTFCERDLYLLQVDANERSISHKVAEYLQPEFPDWNVDCEYNRDGHTPKVLAGLLREESADGAGNRVFPDIIVHRRGQRGPEGNLLVIEMKKSSDHLGIEADRAKLSAYQNELGYQFGVLLICDVGGDRAVPPFECLWVDGQ